MFYIYKFLNKKGEVIYIGKTYELKKRFAQHKKDKSWWNEISDIETAEVKDRFWLSIYEVYYINKFKAKYNKADIRVRFKKFEYPELTFNPYIGRI